MVKFPIASVVPPPTCAPMVPPVMANAAMAAPLAGPFTTVPLTFPAGAGGGTGVVPPPPLPPPQAKRKRGEARRAASVGIRAFIGMPFGRAREGPVRRRPGAGGGGRRLGSLHRERSSPRDLAAGPDRNN